MISPIFYYMLGRNLRSLLYGNVSVMIILGFKDLNSTVAKRGSVFIGLMTPDGAIWFRYQRTVLLM